MAAHYERLLEDLETSLDDLNGDILAWDIFFRCYEKAVGNFGDSVSCNYLRRLKDYIDQHIKEIQQIIDFLSKDTLSELEPDAKTGRS